MGEVQALFAEVKSEISDVWLINLKPIRIIPVWFLSLEAQGNHSILFTFQFYFAKFCNSAIVNKYQDQFLFCWTQEYKLFSRPKF